MTQQVENTIQFNQEKPRAPRKIDLVPRTRNQERLVLALQDANQHIVVTAGPAGTGKTYLAMLAAVKSLREGTCDRISLESHNKRVCSQQREINGDHLSR